MERAVNEFLWGRGCAVHQNRVALHLQLAADDLKGRVLLVQLQCLEYLLDVHCTTPSFLPFDRTFDAMACYMVDIIDNIFDVQAVMILLKYIIILCLTLIK